MEGAVSPERPAPLRRPAETVSETSNIWRQFNTSLFFAALPDGESKAKIAALTREACRASGLTGSTQAPERLHISLIGVGLDGDRLARTAMKAAKAVTLPPFDVCFDRMLSFKTARNRPLALVGEAGTAGIRLLQKALGAEMRRVGFGRTRSSDNPHMTLGHYRTPVAEAAIEPIGWTVREFVLVRILSGESHYDIIGRWPLAPRVVVPR